MATHEQVWIKVNTEVDTNLADAIATLNRGNASRCLRLTLLFLLQNS
jgi:hypothetical protein